MKETRLFYYIIPFHYFIVSAWLWTSHFSQFQDVQFDVLVF